MSNSLGEKGCVYCVINVSNLTGGINYLSNEKRLGKLSFSFDKLDSFPSVLGRFE